MKLERRFYPIEVRVSEGEAPKISGRGVVYNQLSVVIWGMFREQVARGAFTESMAKRDVRFLWNHNTDYPLGRVGNGTLRLSEDDEGIGFENDPPSTSWGNDAVASLRRGDVSQTSFGFEVVEDDWSIDTNEQLIRTIRKGELWEISPVVFPAYPQTEVGLRGQEVLEAMPTMPDWVRAHLAGKVEGSALRAQGAVRRRRLALLERM
ncbi:MAG: HK97 family phage prohead protease [Desulfurellales bacterium]|nr:MAG: HK97 family phage prohead protease [Desulfurellales bacterium]